MRFVEIRGGLRVPISNEELIVSEHIRNYGSPLPRNKLDERQQELARQLVHRGVIARVLIDEKMHYVYNELEDTWR
jgi:hypothetical protein